MLALEVKGEKTLVIEYSSKDTVIIIVTVDTVYQVIHKNYCGYYKYLPAAKQVYEITDTLYIPNFKFDFKSTVSPYKYISSAPFSLADIARQIPLKRGPTKAFEMKYEPK